MNKRNIITGTLNNKELFDEVSFISLKEYFDTLKHELLKYNNVNNDYEISLLDFSDKEYLNYKLMNNKEINIPNKITETVKFLKEPTKKSDDPTNVYSKKIYEIYNMIDNYKLMKESNSIELTFDSKIHEDNVMKNLVTFSLDFNNELMIYNHVINYLSKEFDNVIINHGKITFANNMLFNHLKNQYIYYKNILFDGKTINNINELNRTIKKETIYKYTSNLLLLRSINKVRDEILSVHNLDIINSDVRGIKLNENNKTIDYVIRDMNDIEVAIQINNLAKNIINQREEGKEVSQVRINEEIEKIALYVEGLLLTRDNSIFDLYINSHIENNLHNKDGILNKDILVEYSLYNKLINNLVKKTDILYVNKFNSKDSNEVLYKSLETAFRTYNNVVFDKNLNENDDFTLGL